MQLDLHRYLTDNIVFSDLIGDNKLYKICDKIFIEVEKNYAQSHRYYHTIKHVEYIIDLIEQNNSLNTKEKNILYIAAFFHDVVYKIGSKTNEEDSVEFLSKFIANKNSEEYRTIENIILGTKTHMPLENRVANYFFEMDLLPLLGGNVLDLIKYEKLIAKEYQKYSWPQYKKGRLEFMANMLNHPIVHLYPNNHIRELMEYINYYVPNVGLYAGSFNPFHKGHYNILKKAEKLFDKVIVAMGINPEKMVAMTALEDIKKSLRETLPNHEVIDFSCTLVNMMKGLEKYSKITLIRGLRNGYDFSYELNQIRFYEDMYGSSFPIVLIPCDREFEYISSSAIRNIRKFDEKEARKYFPDVG